MGQLKAFVGHSFLDNDKEVVTNFLDYLKEIQSMNIGFSWENAKPAEAKVLSDKIKTLFEGKNLFIAICTKKEKTINPKKLKNSFLWSGEVYAKNSDYEWKASDWVIQEIGFALGRGMDLILLLEDGVRRPGELQGNFEYIEFNRSNLSGAFLKILETIKSLLARAKPMTNPVADEAAENKVEEFEAEKSDKWMNPASEWSAERYKRALFSAIYSGNTEKEEEIYEKYLLTNEGKNEENNWQATREYFYIWLEKGGSIDTLERMSRRNPEDVMIYRYIAKAYKKFGEEEKAAKIYLDAALIEKSPVEKMDLIGQAIMSCARDNQTEGIPKLIESLKRLSMEVDDGELILHETLRDLSEITGDKIAYLAYAERYIDLRPDDASSRFRLAHAHSEQGHEELALFHYLKIPSGTRDSSEWNNIGVSNDRLGLNGKAVEAYRESEKLGGTLAMSNLALKMLDAGLLSEARLLCNSAKQQDDYDKNIDETLYKIKKQGEEEGDKQKEILRSIVKEHEFYVEYGRAASKIDISDLGKMWTWRKLPRQLYTSEVEH